MKIQSDVAPPGAFIIVPNPADADALVSELEKVRDKLPKEAKDALDKHIKKKTGKK